MDFISEKINSYALLHTSKESTLLSDLNRETYANVMMPRMLSGHLQGRFLSMISKMVNPENILEIGTYTGYSALCLAEGLKKKGELHTIDINEEYASIAERYFNKSEYTNNIKQYIGNAIDIIPKIKKKFQLAFIDADKKNYSKYFDLIIDKVDVKGYVVTDNVLWSGKVLKNNQDEDTISIKEFNKKILKDNRLRSILLPIRDGIMISEKIKL